MLTYGAVARERSVTRAPDARPQNSSAVAGSSRMPATSARNREPFSPSMCRWSKRQRQRGDLADDDLVVRLTHPRLLA